MKLNYTFIKNYSKHLHLRAPTPGFDKLNVYFESAKLNLRSRRRSGKVESMRLKFQRRLKTDFIKMKE